MNQEYLSTLQTGGYFIQPKSLLVFGAGTTRKQIEDWFDNHVNPEHELQAYEDWLSDEHLDEGVKGLWKGQPDFMPDLNNMSGTFRKIFK